MSDQFLDRFCDIYERDGIGNSPLRRRNTQNLEIGACGRVCGNVSVDSLNRHSKTQISHMEMISKLSKTEPSFVTYRNKGSKHFVDVRSEVDLSGSGGTSESECSEVNVKRKCAIAHHFTQPS
jgi:hypothetical protein